VETSSVLIDLLIVFAAGKIAGEIFEWLHQPAVIGELIAGIIIGPGLLGWVSPGEVLSTVATMGVIILMFAVGLETRPSELFKVGARAMIVGCVGIVLPMIAGYYFGTAMGLGTPESIFIGTALVATSVGITARVLADRGFLSTTEARIILAAAVIDDVLGMLVLSLVVGSTRGGVDIVHLGILLLQVAAFIGFEMWLAPKLVARHAHWIDKLKIKTPSTETMVGSLSGGNQQKVVLAKWRVAGVRVLILDHPTRGIDVGAKEDVYELVRDMTSEGLAVILLGDTLDEVIGLSNTILVMRDGEITQRFDAPPGGKPSQVDLVRHMV